MNVARVLPSCLLPLTFLLGIAGAAEIPDPPQARETPLPETVAGTAAEAAARFRPMAGSPAVTGEDTDRGRLFRLPCNFTGTTHDRASWDLPVTADLAAARGVRFAFFCADPAPVSGFNVYFRSGDGWYTSRFDPPAPGTWADVVVDKGDMRIEGKPAGWGVVDTIRISAWRGRSQDTECALANLGALGGDAEIVVVSPDSYAGSETGSTGTFTKAVADALKAFDLSYAVLSDLDLTRERLAGRKVAILPYNPTFPEERLPDLREFVRGGGRLIVFYSLPHEIADLLGVDVGPWVRPEGGPFSGIARASDALPALPEFTGQGSWNAQVARPIPGKSRTAAVWRDAAGKDTEYPAIVVSDSGIHVGHVLLPDDRPRKRVMLLAMLGTCVPDVWEQVARREYERIGAIAGYGGFAELRQALGPAAPAGSPAARALARAGALREQAAEQLGNARWAESLETAGAADRAALEAWCASRPSRTPEFRAFWCHSAFGITGMGWDDAIRTLKEAGFNAILPNMLWGGIAYYPSELLPVYADYETAGDQVAECLAACRRHDVECHVWKVNFNMGSRAPEAFVAKMREAGRVQMNADGTVEERWLCPSHPDNQRLEIDTMVEVARMYPVQGIHFDYIRYPGAAYCFCGGCRSRFEERVGKPVADWPRDVREDPELRRAWLDFRRANITTVVAAVSREAREARPGIRISAAVFRNWPVDRDGIGQDWKVWCDKGYLDFVCPMDYTESNTEFRNTVEAQLGYAGKVPCYPGIGLTTWANPQDAVRLIQQVEICRELGTPGFTVFNYEPNALAVLPYCREGITAPAKR